MNEILEKYKILNDRINNEINEIYKLISVFLTINTGLLALLNIGQKINKMWIIFFSALGIIISMFWLITFKAQLRARNEWIENAKELEITNESLVNYWKRSKSYGVMDTLGLLPCLFIIVWSIFFILKYFELSLCF